MKLFRLLVLVVPLALVGCGLSDQQKADYRVVQNSGVSPAIYDKMVHQDDLSVSDIESLGRAHVSDAITLRYIRDQGSVYYLNSKDVAELRHSGVNDSVVDYMLRTPQNYYGGPDFYPSIGIGFGPYFGGGYWGGGYGGYGYGGYGGGYYPYHHYH